MPDFYHSVPISAAVTDVYAAIATQPGMQGWWTRDTVMQNKVGGSAEFGFDGRGMVFRMLIKSMEPGKSLTMKCSGDHPEWAGTTLEWSVVPAADGAVLSFCHRGWREITPFAASCNSMWGRLMFRLKQFVETKMPEPQWTK
jgi:uncharacterized protein YndB with AHSA1/START domain